MNTKKKLAAKILKTSPGKVRFAAGALNDIAKAITKSDIRGLVAIGKITFSKENHQSRARARRIASQKGKGRQKGKGTRKGTKFSSISRKERWVARVRTQREFLKELKHKGLLSAKNYRLLYLKSKGGYFRNKRHIKLYITEQNLVEQRKT